MEFFLHLIENASIFVRLFFIFFIIVLIAALVRQAVEMLSTTI
ncbi:hypothetical protein BFO_1296 [Tannerella forsythia 92A2]|uniref:Uncharacterized protein n=1 Tax=Tannerella forsythia (strain ATCC 43037 / JCM 10827 / CCUG 21028 A / KCTC 5666 / FDC 338) TaxID=203275 RepID=G8UJS7_TANFA|nr:hypothetical protein BFO_1296 [Tannerella forsythia 92A2]